MNERERLEQIIDLETPVAEAGCLTAQSLVINAMSELDALNETQCDHCEDFFPEGEVNNCDREDPDFHLCRDCQDHLESHCLC